MAYQGKPILAIDFDGVIRKAKRATDKDNIGEGKQNTIESVEDKFKDIGVYEKICTILYRKWLNNSFSRSRREL